MKVKPLIYFALATFLLNACKPSFYNEITLVEIQESMDFIAGDSLKGRLPGTPEDKVLVHYLASKMEDAGLALLDDNGLQEVKVVKGFKEGYANYVSYEGDRLEASTTSDFSIPGFSATDTITAEVYLSLEIPKKGLPEGCILATKLPKDLPEHPLDAYNALRKHALKAADMGVAGLIYLYEGEPIKLDSDKKASLQIPVALLNKNAVISEFGLDEGMELLSSGKMSYLPTQKTITLATEILNTEISTYNTVASMTGSNEDLSNEYVIIGAHHDHLGMGGRGSSSRRQDTLAIHYGADDNASGTIGVIELAQNLIDKDPARSMIFMTFAAEEMGLWGSKYYAENPSIDLSQAQAMINLDMIGRLNENRQLQIGGIGTSPVFKALLDTINKKYNFSMAYSEAGFGPSDHSSFYAKDVPVLFISTGAHTDYHTPFDSKDKINYEGMIEVLSFISDLALELANMPEKIEFTLAGPKKSSGSRGRMGMVTFGLMPEVMYDGNEGMPVSFVTEGKPAAIGGMKGGDIIIEVDGKKVGNVQDYMSRLTELKEGQSVIVKVLRENEKIELLLQL